MQKRKVALFSTQFCPYSQTFVYDEVRTLSRYTAEVFAMQRCHEERFPYEPVYTFGSTLSQRIEKLACESFLVSPTRRALMQSGQYDLIAAHFGPGSIYALPHAQCMGLPLVVTFHGYDVPLLCTPRRFWPAYWRYWLLSKWMFRRVDRFLAASDELHKMLVGLGAPPEKVFTWRLGVTIPEVDIPARTGKRLIQVGRFVEKKGFIDSIHAMALLKQRCESQNKPFDLVLTLIGDGELLPLCRAIVKRKSLQNNVVFLKPLSQEAVFEHILNSDILLAPSVIAKNGDRESGILVAKEAGARYVPVIGTYHGGIPEIIEDEKTGFLVPEHSPELIADRILSLVNNSDLRHQMGVAARKKMENEYRLEDRIAALEQHYDEVISEKKRL
ncbi:MAG: glycosyltransferase [Proteobacteria bacterium]|nr:glycosyltransferase [Pseudomonadota bacterium]